MHARKALGLYTKLLLEALTDRLPRKLKQLVLVNSPKSTIEWKELV